MITTMTSNKWDRQLRKADKALSLVIDEMLSHDRMLSSPDCSTMSFDLLRASVAIATVRNTFIK